MSIQAYEITALQALMEQSIQKGLGQEFSVLSKSDAMDLAVAIGNAIGQPGIGERTLRNYTAYLCRKEYHKLHPRNSTLNFLVQYVWEAPEPDGLWTEFRKAYLPEVQAKKLAPPQPLSPHPKIVATGGMVAGFLSAFWILTLKEYTGFETGGTAEDFSRIFPLIVLNHTAVGGLLGGLIGYWALTRQQPVYGVLRWVFPVSIFFLAFVLSLLLHQLGARDALVAPGALDGRGGPLGEPSFESLAVGLSTGTWILLLIHLVRTHPYPGFSAKMFLAARAALWGALVYGGVFLLFKLLINTGLLIRYDYWIAPWVFTVDFSHPERIVLVPLVAVLYNVCILYVLRWGGRENNSF